MDPAAHHESYPAGGPIPNLAFAAQSDVNLKDASGQGVPSAAQAGISAGNTSLTHSQFLWTWTESYMGEDFCRVTGDATLESIGGMKDTSLPLLVSGAANFTRRIFSPSS